jgi:hypothetical protein
MGTSEARQMLDYAIQVGRGGIYLRLIPGQYAALRRRIVGSDAVESGHAALRTRRGRSEVVTKLNCRVSHNSGGSGGGKRGSHLRAVKCVENLQVLPEALSGLSYECDTANQE